MNYNSIGQIQQYSGNLNGSMSNSMSQLCQSYQAGVYNPQINAYEYKTYTMTKPLVGPIKTKKETHMVAEVAQDLRKFIKDHKSTIYVIAVLLVVDHFMFNGAMKEKLKSLMQNLVGKVEAKLNETKV